MNKNVLLQLTLLFLVALNLNVRAQQSKLDIGIVGGPALADLRGNLSVENNKLLLAYGGGLFIQKPLGSHFSLNLTLGYERKGEKEVIIFTDVTGAGIGSATLFFNMDYLTVPLLVRYSFGHKLKAFVNAGPYASYLLKATMVQDFPPGVFFSSSMNTDETNSLKRMDAGITAGVGVAFPLSSRLDLPVEVRDNLGLVNIADYAVINNGTLKTNSVALTVGLVYHLY